MTYFMRWGIFIYVLMKERRWNLNPVSKFHSNSNKEKIKQMFEIGIILILD